MLPLSCTHKLGGENTAEEELTLAKMKEAQDKMNEMAEEEKRISSWEELFGRNTRARLINFLMERIDSDLFTALDVSMAIDVKQSTALEHLLELEKRGMLSSQVVEDGEIHVFKRGSAYIMEKLDELHSALYTIR